MINQIIANLIDQRISSIVLPNNKSGETIFTFEDGTKFTLVLVKASR